MESVALITEGITDQAVLQTILYTRYGPDLEINSAQPFRDETDAARQGNFGGWENVLDFCGRAEFAELFLYNNFIVIQIDTDCAHHANFGVPTQDQHGAARPIADIVLDVKNFIVSKIDPVVFHSVAGRILYAISVHSLECWLLPLFTEDATAIKISSCERHLNQAVARQNMKYAKEYEIYETLAKGFRKQKNIDSCRKKNASFDIFVSSLP